MSGEFKSGALAGLVLGLLVALFTYVFQHEARVKERCAAKGMVAIKSYSGAPVCMRIE